MLASIVTTSDRPDLAPLTARWRWEAFFRDSGRPFDGALADARSTAATVQLMPQTFVLLVDGEPVGTASLVAHDLDERPDLSPWLAGMFVAPDARGHGYAGQLIAVVEQAAAAAAIATLWLYTGKAERIYARAGWETVETLLHNGRSVVLMRRALPRRT